MEQKKNPALHGYNNGILTDADNKYSKIRKRIQATETQKEAFHAVSPLRTTEQIIARRFFLDHPDDTFSRADIGSKLGLPINHVTRVIYDLIHTGFIEVCGKETSNRTGRTVEVVRLKQGAENEQ